MGADDTGAALDGLRELLAPGAVLSDVSADLPDPRAPSVAQMGQVPSM